MDTEQQPEQENAINAADKQSISVFFPCYNEKDNIAGLVEKAVSVLTGLADDFEIILVDDGSSDGTAELIDSLALESEKIKAIHHKANAGYGAALQTGFRAATKQLVFYTDGDGQFDIAELAGIMPLIKQYDIVSCYRINRRDNLLRKLNAFCWTKLVCTLFGLKLKDIDCAFKLFRREIFDNIEMLSTGALIDTEILARASRKGYTITQTGVHHYRRTAGAQTGANIAVILRAFKELFELRSRILSEK
jgi:glycosyltransferase involved in cell wall biosynthesis